MVHVVFTHDDEVKKWDVTVVGATDATEAYQALNAVILTCNGAIVGKHKAELDTEALLLNTIVEPKIWKMTIMERRVQ